jgi:hypothetical protein
MKRESLNPIKIGISLVIDYFRWSQLTPMITLWSFGLLMLAALFFVNNQEATFDTMQAVAVWVSGLPVIGEAFIRWGESMASEDGVIHMGESDFKEAVLRLWGGLSLVFLLLSLLVGWIFGPFKPWTLKKKLSVAALCSLVLVVGFILVYLFDSSMFNGGPAGWLLMFSGVGLLAFIVSSWCLSVAHALGSLGRLIQESDLGEPKKKQGLI